MFRKIITPTLSALVISSVAFAGGPDLTRDSINGFFMGANIGGAISMDSLSGEYNNPANATSQTFQTSASDTSALTGASIGYAFSITPRSQIALVGDFLYNWSKINQIWHIDSNLTPNTEGYDITQNARPKWQYNAYFRVIHFLSNNFSVYANMGISIADAKVKLTINDNGLQAGNTAGPGNSENINLYGGVLGVGGDYFVSDHNSFSAEFDYFLYSSRKLKTATPITSTSNDQISSRKIQLYIPSLMVGYTYHF